MDWLKINKNSWTILYKLLGDTLFLLLAFFALALVFDGLVPGIISDHISFLRLTLLVFLNLAFLYAIGNLAGISMEKKKDNKKTVLALTALALLVILNSMFKINFLLAIFITVLTLSSGYLLFRNFFKEE